MNMYSLVVFRDVEEIIPMAFRHVLSISREGTLRSKRSLLRTWVRQARQENHESFLSSARLHSTGGNSSGTQTIRDNPNLIWVLI